jgi:hypothetical protein
MPFTLFFKTDWQSERREESIGMLAGNARLVPSLRSG